MRKNDEKTNPASAWNRALDRELVFVLLGRDPDTPAAIRAWADHRRQRLRLVSLSENSQLIEALGLADLIDQERGAIRQEVKGMKAADDKGLPHAVIAGDMTVTLLEVETALHDEARRRCWPENRMSTLFIDSILRRLREVAIPRPVQNSTVPGFQQGAENPANNAFNDPSTEDQDRLESALMRMINEKHGEGTSRLDHKLMQIAEAAMLIAIHHLPVKGE